MTYHRARITPGSIFTWTFTVVGCCFILLFSVAAGGSIFQYTMMQLNNTPTHYPVASCDVGTGTDTDTVTPQEEKK